MIAIESSGITDIGRRRELNEDSLFYDDGMGLYVVADGMGGHNAGEVASQLVVD
ncbi:MAG: serine/threonine-protein phosphatase, partial [Deltaproteobacteria bacterium]|nr:serine/threonine-protein phosphatase [Deltaproteobacteria bacterium]